MKTGVTMTKKAAKISDKPPKHLSEESKAFWQDVMADFALESDALLILRTACEQFDRGQSAREAIERDGLILVGGKIHPGVVIEKQSVSLFLRAMRQLGLDVAAPGQKAGRKN